MDWLSIALLLLVFIAVMLVAGNNLSACVGPAVGSRIISKRFGMLIGAIGFSAGLVTQGAGMGKTVALLAPTMAPQIRAEALLVAILIFAAADVIGTPLSVSMSLVGAFTGLTVASGGLPNTVYLAEVATLWIIAPIIAIILSFLLIRAINNHQPTNIWRRLQAFKVLLIILAFSSAYVLGANTIGLIVAAGNFNFQSIGVAVVAIFIGTFFLGSRAIRRVSEELYLMRYPNAVATLVTSTALVEAATILNVPLSNTQALSAAVFGTAMSYKERFVSLKRFLMIVLFWVLAPILSFLIGLAIGFI